MKILIVEDDFISRKVLMRMLTKIGHCDIAANGFEALEAFVLALNSEEYYDLITLDIMMPELSGMEVLKKIRHIEAERELPATRIIMTTALKDSENVMTAFKNQCDGYICKPIIYDKLSQKLSEMGLLPAKNEIVNL